MENANNSMELPEICKKYDDVSDTIVTYESDIKSLEQEVTEKTEKVKEYLQILKTGTEAGIDPNEFLIPYPLSYYRLKIKELNEELLKIDDEIKSKNANLQDYYKELEEITELIPETGMTKVYLSGFTLIGPTMQWITKDQWENDYKNRPFHSRIV